MNQFGIGLPVWPRLILFAVICLAGLVAFAWWFRRGNAKATYLPDWEYSGAIEMVVWVAAGGGPAMADLLGGQVQVMFSNLPADEYVASGKLRALAVTTAVRATTSQTCLRSANSFPAMKRVSRLAFAVQKL